MFRLFDPGETRLKAVVDKVLRWLAWSSSVRCYSVSRVRNQGMESSNHLFPPVSTCRHDSALVSS
jgi:hypothetical protein